MIILCGWVSILCASVTIHMHVLCTSFLSVIYHVYFNPWGDTKVPDQAELLCTVIVESSQMTTPLQHQSVHV